MRTIHDPTSSPSPAWPGLMLALIGAIGFSGKAIIVKLAYRYGVDAVTLIMYRMLFALPLFVAMAWWAGRGKPALTGKDWLGVAGHLGYVSLWGVLGAVVATRRLRGRLYT